jgi:multiple sugar transport system ATP-binding protein
VRTVEALGSEIIAHVEVNGRPVLTDEVKEVAADLDATVVEELEAEGRGAKLPLVARFDAASRARADAPVEVVVDTNRVHVFDLETGLAVGGHPVEGF